MVDAGFAAGVTDGDAQSYVSRPLSDGKILVGGTFSQVNGIEKNWLTRLNNDGSLDSSFNPGGSGPNGSVLDIVVLPSSDILIGGSFTTYNGIARRGIVRINANGALDETFNFAGSGVSGGVNTISVQPDGKILISGFFSAYNSMPRIVVARLNSDGSLDTSFTSPFTFSVFVEEVQVLSGGKILICGSFPLNNRNDVMRLNSDGTPDLTFNPAGVGTDGNGVWAMRVQSDNKILIGGAFNSYNGVPRSHWARLNADGTLDATFVPPTASGTGIEYIDVLPDGKILASGGVQDFSGNNIALIRLNSNGSIDNTFTLVYGDGTGYHVTRDNPGNIMLTGWFNTVNGSSRRNIVRLNSTGSVDNTFNAALSTYGQIFSAAAQQDGKLVVVGNFRVANGAGRVRIARFNPDGSIDATFIPGSGTFPDPSDGANIIYTVAIQSDGKILIGGRFGGYNGLIRRGIARLNSDGSPDTSFNAGFNDPLIAPLVEFRHILALPDNKIMAAGVVVEGFSKSLFRLNVDGSNDVSFQTGTSSRIYEIVRQSDGKIIAVGSFASYGGQQRRRIVRVNDDGVVDTTFSPATGVNNGIVFSIALAANGQMLIVGSFTSYDGIARNRIARINSNGSLDTSFDPGTGANGTILTVALENDGRAVLGGTFTSYNGAASSRLVRIEANGMIESSFTSGIDVTDARSAVAKALFLPDGKLVIGGTFKTYNNTTRNSLVRFVPVGGPTSTPTPTSSSTATLTPTATPTSTPTNTPTPAGTPSISGTVTYGNAIPAATRFVSNVLISGVGSPNVSNTTGFPDGTYSLTGFGAGSYTVTPTKSGGANNITSFDAARISQHVAGEPNPQLNATQLIVADVSGNGTVSSFDAGMIAKYVAGAPFTPPGIGSTATWRFTPVNRSYGSVTSNIQGEDYSALLMGEVSGNWTNTGARPTGGGAAQSGLAASRKGEAFPLIGGQSPAGTVVVDLPHMSVSSEKEIVVPVSIRGVADKGIISYEFDLSYDPSVIQPLGLPVDVVATVSRGLSVVTNGNEPGLLRVVVYGAFPIDSDGVLLNLKFARVGATGSVSPLTWERIMFNEGDPGVLMTDGRVEVLARSK
ncbi:MAG: cohesin domain-containing protein [Pyrinomonadaceae bacterium]